MSALAWTRENRIECNPLQGFGERTGLLATTLAQG
jgi:hypothetical protein